MRKRIDNKRKIRAWATIKTTTLCDNSQHDLRIPQKIWNNLAPNSRKIKRIGPFEFILQK